MIGESIHISERAAGLRKAFDRGLRRAAASSIPSRRRISYRSSVGGDPYMLRLAEIAGFFADKKVTRLPSRVAELSGVAGFRGTMLPVYDLAALLRYPPSPSARWMAIAAEAPLALTFDSFDGHFRFAADAIAARDERRCRGPPPARRPHRPVRSTDHRHFRQSSPRSADARRYREQRRSIDPWTVIGHSARRSSRASL